MAQEKREQWLCEGDAEIGIGSPAMMVSSNGGWPWWIVEIDVSRGDGGGRRVAAALGTARQIVIWSVIGARGCDGCCCCLVAAVVS
jgi:hypothetical protein